MAGEELIELELVADTRLRWPRLALTTIAMAVTVALVVAVLNGGSTEPTPEAASPEVEDVQRSHVGVEALDRITFAASDDGPTEVAATESADPPSPGSTTPPAGGDTVVAPEASPAPPTTTTTTCANSFNPSCGPFFWIGGTPKNQPADIEMELLTEHPVEGEYVEVRIRIADPDATPHPLTGGFEFPVDVDNTPSGPGECFGSGTEQAFGGWTPPSPRGGVLETTLRYRAESAGPVRFMMCVITSAWPAAWSVTEPDNQTRCPGDGKTWAFEGWTCADPYMDFATPSIEYEVAPAPTA